MKRRNVIGRLAGLTLAIVGVTAGPVLAQQLPPGVTIEQLRRLTPQQLAELQRMMQQAGSEPPAASVAIQTPESLIPQAATTPGVTRVQVDTTQFFVESPYDFGVVAQEADAVSELPLFGHRMFQAGPEAFQAPAYGPVGPDYRLGPGDELFITMWGFYEENYNPTITREGYVVLPKVGQIVLSGLTLSGARDHLLRRMTPSYQALNYGRADATAFIDVSLGKLRAIDVFVMGDVQVAGMYTISSISTAFTALYAAGGPTNRGSLRDIRILRGDGQVAALDAYDYLLRGDRSSDPRLENGDVVFVPTIGPQVAIYGRIQRPAVYEMKPGESLRDLIQVAGGPTASALWERAQIARILPIEERGEDPWVRVVIDVDLREVMDDPDVEIPLADGDVVEVLPIPEDRRNFVIVEGAVWNPGRLEFTPGITIRQAIQEAGGLREEALPSRVEVVRTHPDETTEIVARRLAGVMAGDPAENIALQQRDRIQVYSIHDVYPHEYVRIYGQVDSPGQYLLHDNMTLIDLVARAGGLTKDAWPESAEVARMKVGEGGSITEFEMFEVPLDTTYAPAGLGAFYLRDFDQVFVRQRPLWETRRNVSVRGEVLFPGTYALRRDDETLVEVLERAGGLTPYAYPDGARFYRSLEDAGRVNLHLEEALRRRDSIDNIVMQPGDSLFVPPRVDFVVVKGAVGNPSAVLYKRSRGPRYYINQAGNYAENADRRYTRVILPNGSAWHARWFIIPDPEVEPGSSIFVPIKAEVDRDMWEIIRDTTAILTSLTTVLLLIWQINR